MVLRTQIMVVSAVILLELARNVEQTCSVLQGIVIQLGMNASHQKKRANHVTRRLIAKKAYIAIIVFAKRLNNCNDVRRLWADGPYARLKPLSLRIRGFFIILSVFLLSVFLRWGVYHPAAHSLKNPHYTCWRGRQIQCFRPYQHLNQCFLI